MRFPAALVLALALLAMDCDDPLGPVVEDLEDARARWEASGFDDYDLTLQRGCFCPLEYTGPVIVRVRGGEIVARVYQSTGQPVPTDAAAFFFDVDGLFAFLEDALEQDPAQVEAEFHPQFGYPMSLWIDFRANVADEEQGYTTLALSPQ